MSGEHLEGGEKGDTKEQDGAELAFASGEFIEPRVLSLVTRRAKRGEGESRTKGTQRRAGDMEGGSEVWGRRRDETD